MGIKTGEGHQFKDVKISAVAARHVVDVPGWEVNDAIGVVLEFDGLRVYHSGDTEYDLRLRAMAYDKDRPIHVCIVAINGTGGNMNAHEAALLAWQLGSRIVVPMHHRIWKDFTGGEQATVDPQLFIDTYRHLGGDGEVVLFEVGEGAELRL
jgi:L-ascorbate metabolism protein UlaG (beta-lactamase superfamily)